MPSTCPAIQQNTCEPACIGDDVVVRGHHAFGMPVLPLKNHRRQIVISALHRPKRRLSRRYGSSQANTSADSFSAMRGFFQHVFRAVCAQVFQS